MGWYINIHILDKKGSRTHKGSKKEQLSYTTRAYSFCGIWYMPLGSSLTLPAYAKSLQGLKTLDRKYKIEAFLDLTPFKWIFRIYKTLEKLIYEPNGVKPNWEVTFCKHALNSIFEYLFVLRHWYTIYYPQAENKTSVIWLEYGGSNFLYVDRQHNKRLL